MNAFVFTELRGVDGLAGKDLLSDELLSDEFQ